MTVGKWKRIAWALEQKEVFERYTTYGASWPAEK